MPYLFDGVFGIAQLVSQKVDRRLSLRELFEDGAFFGLERQRLLPQTRQIATAAVAATAVLRRLAVHPLLSGGHHLELTRHLAAQPQQHGLAAVLAASSSSRPLVVTDGVVVGSSAFPSTTTTTTITTTTTTTAIVTIVAAPRNSRCGCMCRW